MSIAVLDGAGRTVGFATTREPRGDGHDREVALARLRRLLARLEGPRPAAVRLAGYCYEASGVAGAFAGAGWTVVGAKGLNDVVGVYGLSRMPGEVAVAGCGTFSQVVYVDGGQAVRWPGNDVARELPDWPLQGGAYAAFVADLAARGTGVPADWRGEVRAALGPSPPSPHPPPERWRDLGALLGPVLEHPSAAAFLRRAAGAVAGTCAVLGRFAGLAGPCRVVLGGGAVGDDRAWAAVSRALGRQGVEFERVAGEPAAGLARFAMAHPEADPWAVLGRERPDWLV